MQIQRVFFFCILMALCESTGVAADSGHKYAVILGGGGEPAGPDTIFDETVRTLLQKLSGADYSVSLLFDGGHSVTKEMLTPLVGHPVTPFTVQSAKTLLRDLTDRVRAKKISSDDQILVVVDSHGESCRPQKNHGVVDSRSESFNMEALRDLSEQAKGHSVRLAIVDLSCFSGCTLQLKNSQTCIISASPAEMPARQFPTFVADLQKGQDLEQTYRQARLHNIDRASPQISTAAGQEAERLLSAINASVYIEESGLLANKVSCVNAEKTAFQLVAPLRAKALAMAVGDERLFDLLEDMLAMYYSKRNDIVRMLPAEEKTVKIAGESIPLRSLVDIDATMKRYRSYADDPQRDRKERAFFQRMVGQESEFRRERERLLRDSPSFARVIENRRPLKADPETLARDDDLEMAARGVFEAERKIYDLIYQKARKDGDEPCAKFIF